MTAKEFDLLYFLFCRKGQVFTKEQLYDTGVSAINSMFKR
ncbi:MULTISPECIES: winged helix-turn-helix domain-containing protein [Faecalicatena]